MQRKNLILTALVVGLVAAPAASANWAVQGAWEPDTYEDANGGYMYADPDTNPSPHVAKVYFNALQHAGFTGVNPNSAAAGSSIRSTPWQTYAAHLGVWKDCNNDGYIGMPEGLFIEYPSDLLLNKDICPEGSVYNQKGWVYEFRTIAPGDINFSGGNASADANYAPKRFINDTQALVWGDRGLPQATPRGSCPVNPLPAGTTSSTGGIIAYTDCILDYVKTVDPVLALVAPEFVIGDEPQTSSSPLNQQFPVHPFYDPYGRDQQTGAVEDTSANNRAKDPAFTAFDCSKEGTPVTDPTGQVPQRVEDPVFGAGVNFTDEDGTIYVIPVLAQTPSVNARGSFYDGLNETEEATTEGCEGDDDNAMQTATIAHGFVESYHGGLDTETGRRETDVYFRFETPTYGILLVNHGALDDDRGTCLFTDTGAGDIPPGCRERNVDGINGTISEDFPYYAGVGVHRTDGFFGGPIWYGLPNYITTPQSVSRTTLQPEGPTYWTFYAHVGDATTGTSGGAAVPGVGTYGSHACPDGFLGTTKGWDCDPSHWWNPKYDPSASSMPTQSTNSDDYCEGENGVSAPNCRNVGVRVGQLYQLRDVDCYDGEIARGTGVYASLVALTPGDCHRAGEQA